MPVYEQGYEAYAGTRFSLGRRWWPLFREEALPYLKKRRFVLLVSLALIPWLFGIFLTFCHTQLGDAAWAKDLVKNLPPVDEKLVARLLTNAHDLFLLFVVAIWVGSGLVARDRKDMTLDIFLGRGVTAVQYLLAKGAALGVFLLLFSLAPLAVLVIFQVGLTGDPGWLVVHSRVLWGTALYAIVGQTTIVLCMLALSSLSRSPRIVGLAFLALGLFGDIACKALYAFTRVKAVYFFSPSSELAALAHQSLGVPAPYAAADLPLALVALFFVALCAMSLAVLWARFARRGVLR